MKILNYQDSPTHKYDSEAAKGVTGRVVIGKEDQADNFCMRIFTVEPGGFTLRHTHDWEHEVFVHSGKGQVYQKEEWRDIQGGTVVFIPGNEEHQIKNRGDEDFVFVCLVPSGAPEI